VLLGLVSPDDVSPLVSLALFVAMLLGGTARWWGPVLGVAVLTALPHVGDALARAGGLDVERSRGVVTAVLLVGVVALRGPLARRLHRPGPAPGEPPAVPAGPAAGDRPVLLEARGVTVRYAGLTALDDAALTLRGGEVHALVGANGSGKSTLLKALSGALDAGEVRVDGVPVPARVRDRVLAGVVRTAQHTALLPHTAPDRQAAVGARVRSAPWAVLRHLLATPTSRARREEVLAREAMHDTGLKHLVGADLDRLAFGDQRLLQLARAVATGARVLLVDEPAAGMTAQERVRLAAVLRRLAGNGRAVLLVEHDMRLVGEVADQVTVLDAGRVLASGPVEAVRADPAVHRAYLGAGSTQTEDVR
jgi:branched-chain amino acid transport system permease protein